MSRYATELETACQAAREAGYAILKHYVQGTAATHTKADQSPVTDADLQANEIICERLRSAFPEDRLLTEESPDDGRRLEASRVWIIDPMDGTRDFVARTGEFCVHVGLAVDGRAVVGVVYQPVGDVMWFAVEGQGATMERQGMVSRLAVSSRRDVCELRFGISRFEVTNSLRRFSTETSQGLRAVLMGASTKTMAVARGELDAVLCVHQEEKEWDTCAPEVIIREAGGVVTDLDGAPLRYNQRELRHLRGSLVSNGQCHAELLKLVAPYAPSGA